MGIVCGIVSGLIPVSESLDFEQFIHVIIPVAYTYTVHRYLLHKIKVVKLQTRERKSSDYK